MPREGDELCWCEREGTFVVNAKSAMGISFEEGSNEVDLWIPDSVLGEIAYTDGSTSDIPVLKASFTEIQVPRWFAVREELEIIEEEGTP